MAKSKKQQEVVNVEPNYWVVAYLDINHIKNVDRDLLKNPIFKDVVSYIPTVKVLKKVFKGEEQFEEVPLLFNYGFFSIPFHLACQRPFLEELKSTVSCIYAWVSDPIKVISSKPILVDGNVDWKNLSRIPVATATAEEIANLVSMSREKSIFSAMELGKINIGDIITLRGYPWEGIDAKVVGIDEKRKKIKVNLLLFQQMKEVSVSFDNVFFTVYNENTLNPDELSKVSLDELRDKKVLNKIEVNLQDGI